MVYEDDRDILNITVGSRTLKEMGAIEFIGWVANKLNNMPRYNANAEELILLVRTPPMSQKLPDEEKVRIVRKMLKSDIAI